MPFHPSSPEIVHVSYGASSDAASGSGDKASSYLDMASQYAPILPDAIWCRRARSVAAFSWNR